MNFGLIIPFNSPKLFIYVDVVPPLFLYSINQFEIFRKFKRYDEIQIATSSITPRLPEWSTIFRKFFSILIFFELQLICITFFPIRRTNSLGVRLNNANYFFEVVSTTSGNFNLQSAILALVHPHGNSVFSHTCLRLLFCDLGFRHLYLHQIVLLNFQDVPPLKFRYNYQI